MEPNGASVPVGDLQPVDLVGAGDGTRTHDVQLGNLLSDWKQTTYATMALDPDHQKPRKSGLLRSADHLTQ